MAPNEPCPSGCDCGKNAFIDWYMDSLNRRDASPRSWELHMLKAILTGDATIEAEVWAAFHSDPDTEKYKRIWMDMPHDHPVKKKYQKAAEKADKGVADEQVLRCKAELAELTKAGSKKARQGQAKERRQMSAKQAANIKKAEAKKTKKCCSNREEKCSRSGDGEGEVDGDAYLRQQMEELSKKFGGAVNFQAVLLDDKPVPEEMWHDPSAVHDWLQARGDLAEAPGSSTSASAPDSSDEQRRIIQRMFADDNKHTWWTTPSGSIRFSWRSPLVD